MLRLSSATTSRPEIPWWVSALDAACLVLLAYAVSAVFGHRVRIAVGPVYISLTSWLRLLLWTAVALGVRHALWRAVPWHTHVAAWARRWLGHDATRAAWPAFLLSRAAVLTVGYIAVVTIGFDPPRPWRALDNTFLDLFARWDSGWYSVIANIGYDVGPRFDATRESSIAFFPGLPILMRAARHLLGVNLWVGGIIAVLTAFFFALVYVYRLAREDMPADQARASLLFLAFYPFAVCYSALLTESLFLLVAAGSFFYFRRNQPMKAAPLGLFAGIVRPNGFLLCVPLALLALLPFARARGWIAGRVERTETPGWSALALKLAVAALPILGVAAYSAYIYSLTGDPFAWGKVQQAWGRQPGFIVDIVSQRRDLIATSGISAYPGRYPIEMMETAAVIFALAGVWPILRRFGLAYAILVVMTVVPPLITMGSVSLGRYTAPLFPLFLWLGASVPERGRPYWLAMFAAGQALVAILFYTWRPPY